VDRLRTEEFGVNVELSEDGRRLMQKQQERLGRSLERLSSDLYSKDTHFVLELIQNADDNSYDTTSVYVLLLHSSLFMLMLHHDAYEHFAPFCS